MSTNPLNDLSKVYLDRVATLNTDLEDKSVKRWEDMGGPTPGNYNSTDDSAKLKQEGKDVAATSKKQVEKATRSSHFRRFGNTTPQYHLKQCDAHAFQSTNEMHCFLYVFCHLP